MQNPNQNQGVVVTDIILSQQNGMGEFNTPPNPYSSTVNTLSRMVDYIHMLADLAQKEHASAHIDPSTKRTKLGDENKITRLILNEFCLFTKDKPLSLDEYKKLLQAIENIASKCHINVHMVLASVGVRFPNNEVYNMSIHVQGGEKPQLNTFAKSVPSAIDAVYNGTLNRSMLGSSYLPKIMTTFIANKYNIQTFLDAIRMYANNPKVVAPLLEEALQLLQSDKYYPAPESLLNGLRGMIKKARSFQPLLLQECSGFANALTAFTEDARERNQQLTDATKPTYPLPTFITEGDQVYSYNEHVQYAMECAANPALLRETYNQLNLIKAHLLHINQTTLIYSVPAGILTGIDQLLSKLYYGSNLSKEEVDWFVKAMMVYKNECYAKLPSNPNIGKVKIPLETATLADIYNGIANNFKLSDTKPLASEQLNYLKNCLIAPAPQLTKIITDLSSLLDKSKLLTDFRKKLEKVQQMVVQRQHIPKGERYEFISNLRFMLKKLEEEKVPTATLQKISESMEKTFNKMEERERITSFKIKMIKLKLDISSLNGAEASELFNAFKYIMSELKKDFNFNDQEINKFKPLHDALEKLMLQKMAISFKQSFLQLFNDIKIKQVDIEILHRYQNSLGKLIESFTQYGFDSRDMLIMENFVKEALVRLEHQQPVSQQEIKNTLLSFHKKLDYDLTNIATKFQFSSTEVQKFNEIYTVFDKLMDDMSDTFKLTDADQNEFTLGQKELSDNLIKGEVSLIAQTLPQLQRLNAGLKDYDSENLIDKIISALANKDNYPVCLNILGYIRDILPPLEKPKVAELIEILTANKPLLPQRLIKFKSDMAPHALLIKNLQYQHFPQIGQQLGIQYDTTVTCTTEGGLKYTDTVDICLDHASGIAAQNLLNLIVKGGGDAEFYSQLLLSNSMQRLLESLVKRNAYLAHGDINVNLLGVHNAGTGQSLPTTPLSTLPFVDASKYKTGIKKSGNGYLITDPPFGPSCVVYKFQPYQLSKSPAYEQVSTPSSLLGGKSEPTVGKVSAILQSIESLTLILEREGLTPAQQHQIDLFRLALRPMSYEISIDAKVLISHINNLRTAMESLNNGNIKAILGHIDKIKQYAEVKTAPGPSMQVVTNVQHNRTN